MSDLLFKASVLVSKIRAITGAPVALVIQCSERKAEKAGPARELYRGPFWLTLKKAGELPKHVKCFAFSAKYGLIPADKVIPPYNVRLSKETFSAVVQKLKSQKGVLPSGAGVVLVAGDLYKRAWLAAELPCHYVVEGAGIGYMLGAFKRWLDAIKG